MKSETHAVVEKNSASVKFYYFVYISFTFVTYQDVLDFETSHL